MRGQTEVLRSHPCSAQAAFVGIAKPSTNPTAAMPGPGQSNQDRDDALQAARERPRVVAIAHAGTSTESDATAEILEGLYAPELLLAPHSEAGATVREQAVTTIGVCRYTRHCCAHLRKMLTRRVRKGLMVVRTVAELVTHDEL